MDQRLINVANTTGDVNAFYALLGEDHYILEGIDIAPFVDTPLHIAIKAKKTDFAVEIANLKPSFARKLNQDGFSPIHLASTHGNLKIVRKLLSKDHDLCLLEGRGNRIPLHFAAEVGNVDVMEALLKDCPDSIGMLTVREETPLHLAAMNGQVEACRVLLEWIVKLNRSELMNWNDEGGRTALDVAAGSPEVVELLKNDVMDQRLITVATDVDAFYTLLGEDKFFLERIDSAPFVDTPLHIAIKARRTNLAIEIANLKPSFARKLNQDGVSPIHLASAHGNLKIVRKLLTKDHDLCLLEGRGNRIPLHFAAEAGNVDVMEALLKDCPDSIGMLTVREETPLHLAAMNVQMEACKVLLEWIVKLNRSELMNWRDVDGRTALDIAAGSPEVVELLENENIEDDVDAFYNLLGEDQFILERIDLAPFVDTPLHIAIKARRTNVAIEIANLKPSFARKLNQDGVSPIHLASTYNNLKIVRELLDKDHDLCLLAGRGKRIPLHFAATEGRVDVMEALLKDCPDSIGMLTVREETPLHLAAKNGHVEACKVLLKSIKKLNRWELMDWKDEDGQTALDAASGSPEVEELLVNEKHIHERNFLFVKAKRKVLGWILEKPVTSDSRSAMLVVLALIITATFQAVVSPPGGVWQDTTTYSNSSNANTTTAAAVMGHDAGKAVMGQLYIKFANINTFGFCASIVAITLLTTDMPCVSQILLMCCMGAMMISYHNAITIITPGKYHTSNFLSSDPTFAFAAILFTLSLFFYNTVIRYFRICVFRK